MKTRWFGDQEIVLRESTNLLLVGWFDRPKKSSDCIHNHLQCNRFCLILQLIDHPNTLGSREKSEKGVVKKILDFVSGTTEEQVVIPEQLIRSQVNPPPLIFFQYKVFHQSFSSCHLYNPEDL